MTQVDGLYAFGFVNIPCDANECIIRETGLGAFAVHIDGDERPIPQDVLVGIEYAMRRAIEAHKQGRDNINFGFPVEDGLCGVLIAGDPSHRAVAFACDWEVIVHCDDLVPAADALAELITQFAIVDGE